MYLSCIENFLYFILQFCQWIRLKTTNQEETIEMALLSQGILQRFNTVVSMFKTNFHLGLIPLIRAEAGMPELTLSSLLWA